MGYVPSVLGLCFSEPRTRVTATRSRSDSRQAGGGSGPGRPVARRPPPRPRARPPPGEGAPRDQPAPPAENRRKLRSKIRRAPPRAAAAEVTGHSSHTSLAIASQISYKHIIHTTHLHASLRARQKHDEPTSIPKRRVCARIPRVWKHPRRCLGALSPVSRLPSSYVEAVPSLAAVPSAAEWVPYP